MIRGDVDSTSSPRRSATIGPPPRRPLLPLTDAVAAVNEAARPLPAEAVALADALGRVLAEPVASADDVPPFDNSAMDGYALRAADTTGAKDGSPVRLRLVGESRAGAPARTELGRGEAIAISTGAVLPSGADAVIRLEDVSVEAGVVGITAPVAGGAEIRHAGEDIQAGHTVVGPGTRLGPAELGVIASVGAANVRCARRPRVAIVTTGDELVPPGEPLRPGAIRNSNSFAVPAQAKAAGCEVVLAETVGDEAGATRAALARGLTADLLVICGGVSVGAHDHVKPALAELEIEQRFWGIALRPGRPTWFGTGPDGAPLVFGLPGNPVSAMVTFELLVARAIEVMTGDAPRDPIQAVMDEPYAKAPGRLHAVRCSLELADDGWHATPTGPQGSHVLTSMLGADGLAMIPAEHGDVERGTVVEVVPLSPSPAATSR
jgi:molybdopterin molybdotransferase